MENVKSFVKPIWLLIGVLGVSAWGADRHLDDLLKQVEGRYNRAKTLEVLFTEQYTRPGQMGRTERGRLMLRKPGRMRWDYNQPAGKQFVSDGKYLYLYTPDDHKAQRMKLQETEDMRAPLAFLLGKLNFDKEFKNIQGKSEGFDTRITAEPKSDNLPYSAVEFVVSSDAHIRQVKVTGFDKSVLDFTFDLERLDPKLDAGLFQFQLPPGAQMSEAEQ
jgi:outer membrane lipoprotein carrier protein